MLTLKMLGGRAPEVHPGGLSRRDYPAEEIADLKGKTVSFTVGTHGGGFSKFLNQIANGGQNGAYNNMGSANSSRAAGGTASGGNTQNITGNPGGPGGTYSSEGSPGESLWNGYGKGGKGGFPSGSNGEDGCVYIAYYY